MNQKASAARRFEGGEILRIDGSYGEGGGQILRTGLSLSCLTGREIEIANIRKSRSKPGLQPQHLTAVNAAAAVSNAEVLGAALSSTAIRFRPGPVKGGDYGLDVAKIKGSAGSTSLVLQTILLPLLFAEHSSQIELIGGTHVPWSPTTHYLERIFLPILKMLNLNVDLQLETWGWYPMGGGRVFATIKPEKTGPGLNLNSRGTLKKVSGISAVANLPLSIAERQRDQAKKLLSRHGIDPTIEIVNAPSRGKGTYLFLQAEFKGITLGFDSLGAIGKRAETVADEACTGLLDYLDRNGCLEPHLADQLIPYLALADGPSTITTTRITRHLITNCWVVQQFLDSAIEIEGQEGQPGTVMIKVPKTGNKTKISANINRRDVETQRNS